MKRQVFSFLLLFAFLLQVSSYTIVYSTFKYNQSWIALLLCENRNAPEKKCGGCCQLKKRLKKQELPISTGKESLKASKEVYFLAVAQSLFFPQVDTSNDVTCLYVSFSSSVHSSAPFHPPRC